MKVTIIGSGYVGLVTGACLADLGNDVYFLDVDTRKIELLNKGIIPIYEPGLEDLIVKNRASGRVKFSTDVKAGVEHGDILFIAVGTPPDEDGSADLKYVLAAARNIGKYITRFKVIVNKSTVPVGTAERVHEEIAKELSHREAEYAFSVVSNPEFLKEGAAVTDFMRPDRIVIGCDDSTPEGLNARSKMRALYAPFNRNHERTCWMDRRSAEFSKYAANAMLATRISFMNELANLAEKVGVDIEAVRYGIGSDPRIGHSFLYAGCGYGGSCFPKDVQALERIGQKHGQEMRILQAVEKVNNQQKRVLGEKVVSRFGSDLVGRHFAIWGLAFKPETDDMREAPSRILLSMLLSNGATVAVFDPIAMNEAKRVLEIDFKDEPKLLENIRFEASELDVLEGADALVIVTEWKAFRSPDFEAIKMKLARPIVIDGRNLFDVDAMQKNGFEYHSVGRMTHFLDNDLVSTVL